jgi:hypothetical protein
LGRYYFAGMPDSGSMKATFVLGFLLSFATVLAAAHYVPWVAHPRLASLTSVVPNGGRTERFVIRLPADRIAATGAGLLGVRAGQLKGDLGLTAAPWLAEQFKLRDIEGNVIGVAARHWTVLPDGPAATWALAIPSRGSVFMSGAGEDLASFDAVLGPAGSAPDAVGNGQAEFALGADDVSGQILGGAREFDGLSGHYRETWTLTGRDANGALRGTIELTSVTFKAP